MATAKVDPAGRSSESRDSRSRSSHEREGSLRMTMTGKSHKAQTPGRFGVYGGRYVPETLMAALEELEREYGKAKRDPEFKQQLEDLFRNYAGRPTPLFLARRLTEKLGGAKVYLKREDLLHTGAHKINNCLGQALLVERMGKHRVIAETGAGQHGVATATVCALFGFECVVYMGTEDMRRQELNVFRMRLLGAEGKLPTAIIACVGGGSNSIGIFHHFLKDKKVQLVGVEAGGRGERLGEHAARFHGGKPGVLHGTYSYVLQDDAGQIATTHSVSAGLDYPSIGPEHAWLKDTSRAQYVAASDREALAACTLLAQTEGIIPALESAHAVADCVKRAPQMKKSEIVIVNVSGRGDKDMGILRENLKNC